MEPKSPLSSPYREKIEAPIGTVSEDYIRSLVQKVGDEEGWADAYNQLHILRGKAKSALLARIHDPQGGRARLYQDLLTKFMGEELRKETDQLQNDRNWNKHLSMPGLKKYLSITGKNNQALQLWVEMVKEEAELFVWFEMDESIFFNKFCERVNFLKHGPGQSINPQIDRFYRGNLSAFYLFASHKDYEAKMYPKLCSIRYLFDFSLVPDEINDLSNQIAQRRLYIHWINHLIPADNDYDQIMLIQRHHLTEAHPFLIKFITSVTDNPWGRILRYPAIFELLTFDDIPDLQKILNSQNNGWNSTMFLGVVNNVSLSLQPRDILLIHMVKLTKQAPEKFGFNHSDAFGNSYGNQGYFFMTDKDRENGYKLWQKYFDTKILNKKKSIKDTRQV